MRRYGFVAAGAGLLVLWGLTLLWVPRLAGWISGNGNFDLASAGQVGDLFGAVNSLFSGLALIGVVYGLHLQIEHRRREKQPEVFARLAADPGPFS